MSNFAKRGSACVVRCRYSEVTQYFEGKSWTEVVLWSALQTQVPQSECGASLWPQCTDNHGWIVLLALRSSTCVLHAQTKKHYG